MKAEFVSPRFNNTVYQSESGKLYQFKSNNITVFSQSWPHPRAWIKTSRSPGWQNFRPSDLNILGGDLRPEITRLATRDDGQLMFPFALARGSRLRTAHLRWLDSIPVDIRDRIAQFNVYHHWYILSFLGRCGSSAVDMLDANPALAFLLAVNEQFRVPAVQRPLRAARGLLEKNQNSALKWLGFPGNKSTRRILRKIKPGSLNVAVLKQLRDVLTASTVTASRKRLSHLKTLNDGIIRIICDPDLSEMVTLSFLDETGQNRKDEWYSPTVQCLIQTHQQWLKLRPRDRQPVFHCQKQLFDLQSELADEEVRIDELMQGQGGFPEPPLPADGDRIVPIGDEQSLTREGREQKNCVADYQLEIFQRRCFIYSVNWPQRCTLSIVPNGNVWEVDQLKRACNERPSLPTRRYVAGWIKKHSLSSPI